MSSSTVVGLQPWLPWPLSRWRWWTEPVRAERLAVLRLGIALLLLIDILTTYLPRCADFFGRDGLGRPEVFAYWARAPKWHWSLLHGVGDPLLSALALLAAGGAFVYLLAALPTRREEGERRLAREAALVWAVAAPFVVLGQCARFPTESRDAAVLLGGPGVVWAAATLLVFVHVWKRLAHSEDAEPWVGRWLLAAWLLTAVLAAFALWKWWRPTEDPAWFRVLLGRWDEDADTLRVVLILWALAALSLAVGLWSRACAVLVWVLSTSFATLNPCIDNAGDGVRSIALFYLMLCPCGAAWSVDSWLARRRGQVPEPLFLHPWPLRLLFLQLVFIYFCNGIYKITGDSWLKGDSLYYVLNDVVLARFSYVQFPVPIWLTRVLSWTVLVWEITFPALVACRWTRTAALVLGVGFHLGIFASMELGFFAPYMIALYLPLLPWGGKHGHG